MRMWMVYPRKMCQKHLCGEHVECHMLFGSLSRGKSITGFLRDGLVDPSQLNRRHDALAEEMLRRGYNHQSPLAPLPEALGRITGNIDVARNIEDLRARCPKCAERLR